MKTSLEYSFSVRLLTILALAFSISPFALGDPISFHITNPAQTIASGGTVIFEGTVTNDSGGDLFASDLFFNLFNFNPVLTPNQLLGIPDFAIPSNTTSAVVDLFSVMAGSISKSVPLSIDLNLEDINSDLSSTQTVFLNTSVGTVPEPMSLFLMFTGLALLIVCHRQWRFGR